MGITWKDLRLWNCKAKNQNEPLSVEAPWACFWIASLPDKLYLSLKKTHPAFLVVSSWFGEWLSSLAAALGSATDEFSGRTWDNGNWILEKLLFSSNSGVTRIWLSEKKKNPTEPHTGCCGVTLSVLESKLSTAKAGCGTFRDHWGLLISSHCHHECKTAPSLSEPVRPAWGLMFCPFKLSQILGTAYSLSKSMDQAPTPQIFSHSLSIRFSLMCSQLLFHP